MAVETPDAPPRADPAVILPAAQTTSQTTDEGSALGGLVVLAVIAAIGFGGFRAFKR